MGIAKSEPIRWRARERESGRGRLANRESIREPQREREIEIEKGRGGWADGEGKRTTERERKREREKGRGERADVAQTNKLSYFRRNVQTME